MDRIQEALNKAEEQRRKVGGGQPPRSRAGNRATPYQEVSPDGIEYSQTRTIPVPQDVLRGNRLVAGVKGDPLVDIFRVLRTKILFKMQQDSINTIAITSPNQGGGKSMIAANLAMSLAMDKNYTVLLVDLDLRRPSIHKYFGFEPESGLSDYLTNDEIELSSLLINPDMERLVLLPAGKPVKFSSELLSTDKMAHLLKDICGRYNSRIIIFDLPPLLHIDDALMFLPHVQSSLLVVEEGVNTPGEIKQCLHLLENSNLLGTVYNKAHKPEQSPY